MKKKFLAAILTAAMVLGLTACGGSADTAASSDAAAADTTETTETAEVADTSAAGELIKVGIINNDPNESGYRTANDKDMKNMFTEANGYEASLHTALRMMSRSQQPRSLSRTVLIIFFFLQLIQLDGILY